MDQRRGRGADSALEMKALRSTPGSNPLRHCVDINELINQLDPDSEFHPVSGPTKNRQQRQQSISSVQSFELYTPDEEKKVLRKLDVHVVLFMSFLYLLSFLDRSNIGNAKIAGLSQDLGLTDAQFEWLLTAFYITYIAFEWMIMLYHFLTPHVYISMCVFSWGLIASLQALATSFPQLLLLRAMLGISEAAFSPGVPFFLSFFYRREELALRAGIQVSAAPLAASFAGSLAYLITKLGRNGPLAPWRLLFLAEGFPSVLVAVLAWRIIPDSVATARFLTPRERKIAGFRLRKQNDRGVNDKEKLDEPLPPVRNLVSSKRVNWREITETVRDPKCYLTALMFMLCNIAFSSMPVFLPTVIHSMGYSALSSQALSAPPYLFAFVAVLLSARASDSLQARSPFVIFLAILGSLGYATIAMLGWMQWGSDSANQVRYLAIFPAAAGFFGAVTIIITWTMNNQESEAKKGMGMTILNIIGQCGPLIGTRLYPDSEGPFYVRGMTICASAMLLVAILAGVLRMVLSRENARRSKAVADDEDESSLLSQGHSAVVDQRIGFVLML